MSGCIQARSSTRFCMSKRLQQTATTPKSCITPSPLISPPAKRRPIPCNIMSARNPACGRISKISPWYTPTQTAQNKRRTNNVLPSLCLRIASAVCIPQSIKAPCKAHLIRALAGCFFAYYDREEMHTAAGFAPRFIFVRSVPRAASGGGNTGAAAAFLPGASADETDRCDP